jgi:hypothetical protein
MGAGHEVGDGEKGVCGVSFEGGVAGGLVKGNDGTAWE